ncbi:hypothetical protein [Sphingobacterium faecium]|uniref:hypothetical protein n=1 Tax=Sphingobacterium faecium TaxID=34087 RepID=UPI00320905DD
MKNLILFLVTLFFSTVAFSQARALRVENHTNCVQYYQVFGDELCVCGNKYNSPLIAINPGSVHNYTSSMPLGGTYPSTVAKSIVGTRIPNGPAQCQPAGGTVGEPGCGIPPVFAYLSFNSNCVPCANTTARWFPATNCGQARLIFTP